MLGFQAIAANAIAAGGDTPQPVTISAAWAEAADTASFLAAVSVLASAGWVEEADLADFSASVLVTARMALVEEPDQIAATILLPIDAPRYARAPAGPGYVPRSHYNECRPAAIQRNDR